ncbi:hypothetical protein ACRWXJ_22685, partial [Escherichia coli]
MSRIFAYCRISTLDQTTENQRREIESAGFKIKPQQIIEEHIREGANKRGNSSRLTQSFHFFMFEPIFSPVNA